MTEAQIKAIIEDYIDHKGMTRQRAFQKFRTAQWKTIIEWEGYLDSLTDRYGVPLPNEWASVVDSVTTALGSEREAIVLSEQIEATNWRQ